ncbi:MAG: ComF family protein [Chitinophagaceae bacterium]|nr:ComF family protein [Chitinophagaceae bacterium]
MIIVTKLSQAFMHLLYPHICAGCGHELHNEETQLCLQCLHEMPHTGFDKLPGNPVEKIFWGRLPLTAAMAGYYFTKGSVMQQLMHQLKYKGNKDLGIQLGRMLGHQLAESGRIMADALIPLPLYPAREKKRGYNQATLICHGMADILQLPVFDKAVTRPHHTTTQTRKKRIERWDNIEGKFLVTQPDVLQHKKLLLVDDVVTTGATLEACGAAILGAGNVSLSIACLCMASH